MDGRELRQKGIELFQKYRYGVIVLLVGIFLMLLPVGNGNEKSQDSAVPVTRQQEEKDFETRLSEILSKMQGAGRVQVFLSEATGEITQYQMDEDLTGGDLRKETVVITGSDRCQQGLVRRIDPPSYLGAIVVCQGADNAAVRLSITEAVANATGLGANQISVLKMK